MGNNWNELMGRLEKEGVVFWSLPDDRYWGDLRPRRKADVLREKVEHFREGDERDFEGVAKGADEE
jgi:hypothetical protein